MRREIRPTKESLFLTLRKLFQDPKKRICGLGWGRIYARKERDYFTIFVPLEGRAITLFKPREEGKFVVYDNKKGELGNKEIAELERRIKAERPKD